MNSVSTCTYRPGAASKNEVELARAYVFLIRVGKLVGVVSGNNASRPVAAGLGFRTLLHDVWRTGGLHMPDGDTSGYFGVTNLAELHKTPCIHNA